MPRPIIYVAYVSPACRAVLLAAAALGVEVEVREIDLQKHEQLTLEFVKVGLYFTLLYFTSINIHIRVIQRKNYF